MCSKCIWIKLQRLPGIITIHDDICVYGKTQEQHDKHLPQLMKTATRHGLVFNSNKCHISQPQITFYGTIFSVLGLVNYLQFFLSGIASKTTFLHKQISQWDWNPSTDNSFQKLNSGSVIHSSKQPSHTMIKTNP